MAARPALADQLLDAQVAWVMAELEDGALEGTIRREVADLWDVAATVPLAAVVDLPSLTPVLARLLATVPASTTVSTMVQATADLLHEGPQDPVTPADLVAREDVEALVAELLALRPLVEQGMDRLAESPLVGTLASRFVTRLVVDVLEANRSMAQRIPGVGSIVSLGTSAATRVVGAVDKQAQQLLGDTAGKGAAFAVRRLNKVVMDTLRDPLMHDALMEVWDTQSARSVDAVAEGMAQDDARRLAGVLQDIAIGAAPTPAVMGFLLAWVEALLEVYGDHPVTTLLEELGIGRDDVLGDAQVVVGPIISAMRADGRLEAMVRARLEPFWDSPQVAAMLTA